VPRGGEAAVSVCEIAACPLLRLFDRVAAAQLLYRVPTNLESLELAGNFVNLENSGISQGI